MANERGDREAEGVRGGVVGPIPAPYVRRGEVLGLKVTDVNFDAGMLVVQKGKSARAPILRAS